MIEFSARKKLLSSSGEFTLSLDISIPEGELVAFFGASGTGKTTSLRMIAGLTAPDCGYLQVKGNVWLDSAKKVQLPVNQRPVGFVFQNYALFPNMTVRENLLFAQQKKEEKHVQTLLEVFGLEVLQHRKPSLLSGGQQQRVALARAIARKPELLLLDEPLSALDMEMRTSIQNELRMINREWGITTILVTHDISEIFRLCSRVYSFNGTTVEDKGAPANLFNSRLSGKVQFVGEVLECVQEDIVRILTLVVGNTPVKVVVPATEGDFFPGDKVLIASKAFNPIICKL
jgi:molybdate transport system ATP-binding protein